MAFKVASIKPWKPGTNFIELTFPLDPGHAKPLGDRFSASFPLSAYIEFAYELRPGQVDAALGQFPNWVSTDVYEIEARAEGNPTKDQMRLMMQSLLADRFKLVVHFETQEVPVLALTLVKPGKIGPKLRRHAEGAAWP